MSAGGPGRPAARSTAWLHVALLAAAFAALFAWTWGRWPDVVIDYGRELYVPWRMLEGDQLFRDLSWFNGPLSPHWNALVFRAFGVGLSTLVWADAALFACVLALLHDVIRGFASRVAATLACLVVMAASGFGQLLFIGNYNFICPYSHEATHGVLLGLGALAAARRLALGGGAAWALRERPRRGARLPHEARDVRRGAGGGRGRRRALRVPPAPAAAADGRGLRARGALAGRRVVAAAARRARCAAARGRPRSAPGRSSPRPTCPQQRYYLASMGLDRPAASVAATLRWAVAALAVLAPGVALAFAARAPRRRPAALALSAAATAALCALLYGGGRWLQAPRPWPLFAALALAFALRRALARGGAAEWAGAAAFAAFSLAMTAKMILNARLYHYGFALGLPATALVAAAAWSWLPARVEAAGGSAAVVRAGVAAALACFAGAHLVQTARMHAGKTVEVGAGADRFLADARGKVVNAALAWLDARYPPGTARPTLAALPEGVTINYLSRTRNPTPYFNFMPPEIILFGEDRILEAFRASPPDLVLLVHKDTSDYGLRWFGRDYAEELGAWLRASYGEVERFGDPPFRPRSRFGIDVLARRRTQ